MPLRNGYGVVIGPTLTYYRDPPDTFGRHHHATLVVHTPDKDYRCPIDVDPKYLPDGVQWRTVRLRPSDLTRIRVLPDGWHQLAPTPTSGALDYIRSAVLYPPLVIHSARYGGILHRVTARLGWTPPWNRGTGAQALSDLESIIGPAVRCYVFGEPFTLGAGVHNIHQNQGDSVGSGHQLEDGVFQDGGTIVETRAGECWAFLSRFITHSFRTDPLGHPI